MLPKYQAHSPFLLKHTCGTRQASRREWEREEERKRREQEEEKEQRTLIS